MPLFPLPAILFCATCGYMLFASVDYAGGLSMLGIAPLIVGLALWLLLRSAKKPESTRKRGTIIALFHRPSNTSSAGDKVMANESINGKRIAFLATCGVEQVELTEPWKAVKAAGGTPELVSIKSGEIQGYNHDKKADTFRVDKTVGNVSAEDYDGLVLPGGVANPDTLRTERRSRRLRPRLFQTRQTGRRNLPRSLDASRGRRGREPHVDIVAQHQDRHPQRRRSTGSTKKSSSMRAS